ncbi:DUF523 and DUF1722 domain-containing protein [Myxococcota bacterium]|nr:DUF523 and DUF1722 domain-containing protein [Myxococcota bacterium]MBU1431202.1 DUF523 and DUF1722 domain-containing protein [Myxococcota bacterium]MBU1899075.1 DUF523 and DUF1722 domain-containing protein [Myxococcota bacterium]
MDTTPAQHPLRVGVSACVIGQEVRFNGGHKLSHFVRDILGPWVEFVPVCPEVEIGMSTPRPALRLVQIGAAQHMIAPASGADYTEAMRAYAADKVAALAQLDLCGYILQKGSPSCGMARVKVYPEAGGRPDKAGQGLFAEALMRALPHLPVEEDGRLHDPDLRENFIERLFAYRRLRDLASGPWRLRDLIAFHSREKFLLLAHHRPTYEALGRLVAEGKGQPPAALLAAYERGFLDGLAVLANRGRHTDTLQHLAGFLKQRLDPGDKAELHALIDRYQAGFLPRIAPITLLRHHIRRHPDLSYLAAQTYLEPRPQEMVL